MSSVCGSCGSELTTGGCLVCMQKGQQYNDASETCRACSGLGYVVAGARPQKCPVCEGRGLVAKGFYDFPRKVTSG